MTENTDCETFLIEKSKRPNITKRTLTETKNVRTDKPIWRGMLLTAKGPSMSNTSASMIGSTERQSLASLVKPISYCLV